ncbi:MAG: VacJ family lipoprotein [Pseudomonadota bacterium]
MNRLRLKMLVSVLVAVLALPGHAEALDDTKDVDPWRGLNQVTYKFNDRVDSILLKPLARGYQKFVPAIIRFGIGNAFGNLDDVNNSVNNLLQGKVVASGSDIARILVNSTLGVGGLLDPASKMGLKKHDEDFGQTLSVWGLPRGPYLVLPFLGPSTVTDSLARPLNSAADPLRYLHPVDHRNLLLATRLVDQRAGLLAAERSVFGDPYLFIRDAYLQRRDYLINDGKVTDDFGDDF